MKGRFQIEAGALVRRPIRRYLLQIGYPFEEEKGWLDSVFYAQCTKDQYQNIANDLNKWQSVTN